MKWTKKGHEFDRIGAKWENGGSRIFIYGAGIIGASVFRSISFLQEKSNEGKVRVAFIDSNPERQGTSYLGCDVVSMETALRTNKEDLLIIIAVSGENRPNVVRKCIASGLTEGEHFFDYQEFIQVYLPIYTAYHLNKVYHKGVSFAPTTKCILRCRDCLSFMPYVKNPSNDALEDVKRDLNMFFTCIDYVGVFSMAGGELFLHPECKELFQYIGENFRHQIITLGITTSGALTPDDEMFRILKRYDYRVHVSDYRRVIPNMTEKYNRFVEKLKEFQIDHVLFEDHDWIDLGVFRNDDRLKTEQEKIDWFDACGILWGHYKNGRLNQCCSAGYAAASGVLKGSDEDSYDLRTCVVEMTNGRASGEEEKQYVFQREKCKELMEFGTGYSTYGYVQMCAKCNGHTSINRHIIPPAVQLPKKEKEESHL